MEYKHARSNQWAEVVDEVEACRRAGGRRRYNAQRQVEAELRRMRVVKVAVEMGLVLTQRGARTAIARRLGVSRSTISRDVPGILTSWQSGRHCAVCGNPLARI